MPWILAGGGAVVVAVAVVLVLVLTGGGDTSSPQGVAESAVTALNDKDVDALTKLTCGEDKELAAEQVDPSSLGEGFENVKVSFELGEVTQDSDTAATAKVTITFSGLPEETQQQLEAAGVDKFEGAMKMENGDSGWCINDFTEA